MQLSAYLKLKEPEKWQLAESVAQTVGAQFLQGHQVVQNRSDDELELRGKWQQFPVRMRIDVFDGEVYWDMKAPNPANANLSLKWDPDAVPNVGKFSGEAASDWDDDPKSRVFFANGYFMEGAPADEERRLAIYQSLHEQVRSALANYMVQDRIGGLYCNDRGELEIWLKHNISELPDPVNQIGRAVWLLGQLAWGLSQLAPSGSPAQLGPVQKMVCGYCRTMYLWSQNQACPNCGARPKG